MLDSLQEVDTELDLMDVSVHDIIESLTLEDVYHFLETLGVDQIAMYPDKEYLVCPTICHNPLEEAESMKLYWYHNHKIFRCYTECNESMSIFTLYQKFMRVSYRTEVNFYDAVDYVKRCIKHINISREKVHRSDIDFDRYKYDARLPVLPEYSKAMLTYFMDYHHPAWLRDGISAEAMDKFHIGFSIAQNKISIPHFDINGRLVGIRGRALDPEEVNAGMKYTPFKIGNTLYSHPLGMNLYGIYEHQNAIHTLRKAIIAEGEKSVLLSDRYDQDFSTCVACCGSAINKYQVSLLTNILGANEITIAFDKEYTDWRSTQARLYREKIEAMCRKYRGQAAFYYIWDMDGLLREKDSPFDRGKEVFEELYKHRIRVR